MTYSIVARDPLTGRYGVAVQSHAYTVGPIVPWLEAGVGAIATQAFVNVGFGPIGLEMLRNGWSAEKVIAALVAGDETPEQRQIGVVDTQGRAAAYTGSACVPAAGHVVGGGFTGLAAAAWLRHLEPGRSVGVFEAGSIGAGSSGHTGGMALAESASGDLPGLGDVLQGFERILRELGVHCDLTLSGAWEIGRSEGEEAGVVGGGHGDAVVWGGPARLRYHGVSRIVPHTAPPELSVTGRFNLTFREY